MAVEVSKPVILLDVDGPLNPWSAPNGLPRGFREHFMRPRGWEMGKPLKVRLRASDGFRLSTLGCDIIWATTWEDEANEWIGPHIGLPKLPFIDWIDKDYFNPEHLYWKTKRVVSWMNENRPGIPFIWLDDEVRRPDRDYIEKNAATGSKILIISPRIGITGNDYEAITEWKQGLELK